MQRKLVICLLVILMVFIGISINLSTNGAALKPAPPSVDSYNGAKLLVLIHGCSVSVHSLLKLGASLILVPARFIRTSRYPRYDLINRIIRMGLSYFIVLFFIFYQTARTNRKKEAPDQLMVSIYH